MGHQNFVECILVHMFHLIELHVKPCCQLLVQNCCWSDCIILVKLIKLGNAMKGVNFTKTESSFSLFVP